MKKSVPSLLATSALLLASLSSAHATIITNGSFETGDFSGWATQDLSSPFYALQVTNAGTSAGFGFFTSAPTDGAYAAINGFDGNGPGTIRLSQDVTVTIKSIIQFDYRAAWNLNDFCGASCEDRTFKVNIETVGGGTQLATFDILTAPGNTTVLDTGDLMRRVDLKDFIGQTVSLNFDWTIPENFTGPGFFQLDNVYNVPEPGVISLLLLGVTSLGFMRRKPR